MKPKYRFKSNKEALEFYKTELETMAKAAGITPENLIKEASLNEDTITYSKVRRLAQYIFLLTDKAQ
jgi:hypothetical protein